jgi:hypothetical protein
LQAKGQNMPQNHIIKLKNLCEAREVLIVECAFLKFFAITKIVIEDYEFPFTKGMANQMYSIKAVSDDFDVDKLLIKT